MAVYIALLRGINVGGKNKIKMADLKCVFESIGLSRVETYIQSGNVLFESNEMEDTLQMEIENAIKTNFGISVAVILRTAADIEQIIRDCPFSEEEVTKAELSNSEGESLYVSLLSQTPPQEKIDCLNRVKTEDEEYRMKDREIYLLFRRSIRNSKLADSVMKLGVPTTVRHWKTINKIHALIKSRGERS